MTESDGLVGHYFHSFVTEDDGCVLASHQGVVLDRIEPGFYLVEYYDWFMGYPAARAVVAIADMVGWNFYDDNDWMNETYRTVYARRSDDHLNHERAREAA